MFRGYDKRGHIVGGRLVVPARGHAEEVATAALDDLFADPDVAVVHVRAVEFGCFHAEVRRPPVNAAGGRVLARHDRHQLGRRSQPAQ